MLNMLNCKQLLCAVLRFLSATATNDASNHTCTLHTHTHKDEQKTQIHTVFSQRHFRWIHSFSFCIQNCVVVIIEMDSYNYCYYGFCCRFWFGLFRTVAIVELKSQISWCENVVDGQCCSMMAPNFNEVLFIFFLLYNSCTKLHWKLL